MRALVELKRIILCRSLVVWLLIGWGGVQSLGDVVSMPRRLFGLGDVRSMAASPDQQFMATAGQGGAFLWDLQTGDLLHRLEVDWSVTSLAFSPDSKILLGAGAGTIRSWNVESGKSIRDYPGSTGDIFSLQFSANGQTFVSVAGEGIARIWSVATGAQVHTLQMPGIAFFAAALSPNGQLLATLDPWPTNNVKIWDVATETLLRSIPKTNWVAEHLLFNHDGHLVTSAADRSVVLWNIDSAQEIRSFSGVAAPTLLINELWLPDSSTLAAVGNDGRVFMWNLNTAESLPVIPGDPTIAATGVPGAFLALMANDDYVPRLREYPSGNVLRTFPGHTTSTHNAVAFSPDGQYVVSGGTEAATRLWHRQTGVPVRNFVGSGAGTMSAAFSADGSNILTTVGLPNPAARLWKAESGELVREFGWSGSWPMSAAFSKDGTRIAAGAQDERVRIFNTATGALLRTLSGSGWMRTVAFSPNEPLLACGSSDSNARLFNHETGQLLQTSFASAGAVVAVAFSPNGGTLLVAWNDGLIRLFDPVTFALQREFLTAAAFLESAAYSPDGQFILTGEGWPLFTATFWDAQTAEPLRTFTGHKWAVSAVAFSSTGASILTAGERVREWSVADLAARLRIRELPDHIQLTWSLGQLQHATALNGPWQNVTNATSPLNLAPGNPTGFYRVSAGSLK